MLNKIQGDMFSKDILIVFFWVTFELGLSRRKIQIAL
jgi:hypothetical protein